MFNQFVRSDIVYWFLLCNFFADLIKWLLYSLVNLRAPSNINNNLQTWDGGQHLYRPVCHSSAMPLTSRGDKLVGLSRTTDAVWSHWALSSWQDWFTAFAWSGPSHQVRSTSACGNYLAWSLWTKAVAIHHQMADYHKPWHTESPHTTKYQLLSHHTIVH